MCVTAMCSVDAMCGLQYAINNNNNSTSSVVHVIRTRTKLNCSSSFILLFY